MVCLCKSFHKHYICGQEFSSELFSCAHQHLVYVWKFYHMLDTLYVCQNPGFQSRFPFQHLNMVVCHLPFLCFLPSNTFWNPKEIAWCWNWNIWLNFLRVTGWLRDFLPIYRLSRLAKMKMGREGMSTRHIGIPGQHCLAGQLSLTKFMLFIWGAQAQESAAQPLMTFMIFSRGPLHQNERYREKLCVFGEFLVFDSNPCYADEHNLVKILLPKFQRQKIHHNVAV